MKDIEIAKKILEEEDLTLVIVKDGELIFKSHDKGIKPIYYVARNMKEETKRASAADKVIGKGAALLYKYIDIKEVFSQLISLPAIKELEDNNISYELIEKCGYIKNRDGSDYCPIEKLSMDIEEPEELLKRLEGFFNSMKKG